MCAWRFWGCSVAACMLLVACGREEVSVRQPDAPPVWSYVEEIPPESLSDDQLSWWFTERGRFAEALPVIERLLAVRSEAGDPLALAQSLLSLGMTHDALGDSNDALAALSQAWDLFHDSKAAPAELGACADALGIACHGAGLYADAERALSAAIDYRLAASPGKVEPWVMASRVHLGKLYLTMAHYEEAERLLKMALASAKTDSAIASRSRQMGIYHHTLGAYSNATNLFEQALAASKRAYGDGSPQVAAVIGDLGLAQLRAGELAAARKSLERSREIVVGAPKAMSGLLKTSADNLATFYLFVGEADKALPLLGEPNDAVGFNNLGSALQMTGEFANAGECFERARSLAEAELDAHHPLRVQILQNLACLRSDLGDTSGALDAAHEAGSAAVELLGHLLEFGNETQRLEFRRTSDPLSLLCSFGAPAEEIAEMLRRTKGVVLDSLLGSGEAGADPIGVQAGQHFIDYAVYQRYLGRGGWEQCYGAVVVSSDGARWVELGSAKRLRALLADLRAHMDKASGGASDPLLSCEAVLSGVYDFCVRPLGDIGTRPTMATDGDLKFIPFAALQADGKFLCEGLEDLRLVPSGRSATESAPSNGGWFQCAIADYRGDPPKSATGELRERLEALGSLPGVNRERTALARVADFKALPTAKSALMTKLSTAPAPRVVHFSCHGLFLGDGERPMSRSGLVLSGRRMLTAGEIAGLPLAGTELVTLSACDTGLGANVPGEGVLGLQRGFQLAGAENILMTLWAVGDAHLPAFMADFYGRFKAGTAPSESLWQTQRERLKQQAAEGSDLAKAVWIAGGFSVLSRGGDASPRLPEGDAPSSP